MLFVAVCCLAVFVWFGVTVQLGDHTLFGHLRAIGGSKESQELWKGAKAKATDAIGIEKAREAMKEAKAKLDKSDKSDKPGDGEDKGGGKTLSAAPPQERLGVDDREAMKKLIGSAQAHNTRPHAK
jgi:hypothetical protein